MAAAFAISALILLAAVGFLPFRPDWSEVRALPVTRRWAAATR